MGWQVRHSHSSGEGYRLKFVDTPLAALYVVELEPARDDRGFFARSFCAREFKARGLDFVVAQCNVSFNERAGTLRGLHFQARPYEEAKLVRCTRGAIYDVAVDIRPNSPTHLHWYSVELTPDNGRMIYIPPGFAHGFQTLEDRSEVFYLMSEFYEPNSGRGLRWDDPTLAISWPIGGPIISDKDRAHPLIKRA
jgi:dTDP-4-dehydrorhamnose 3,5-epimerase